MVTWTLCIPVIHKDDMTMRLYNNLRWSDTNIYNSTGNTEASYTLIEMYSFTNELELMILDNTGNTCN